MLSRSFEKAILSLLILGGVPSPYTCLAQVDTVWTRDHKFREDYQYVGNEIAFGPDGSVNVTGEIVCCLDGHMWGTIKYTPYGDELWAAGPGLGSPCCASQALAIDKNGDIYTSGDINVTIKYSFTGDVLWMRRYGDWGQYVRSRAGSRDDIGGDIAVDDSGYAYVLTSEFMTIKFTPQGDTVWTRTYLNQPNSGLGRALAVSRWGDVWVTGEADHGGADVDIVTIHYSSHGDLLWTRNFNGAANGADEPRALALDDSGYAYVTGTTYTAPTASSYCTIKYTPAGDTSWVRTYTDPAGGYSGGRDIAIDKFGQVYVTGSVNPLGSPSAFGTIKYSPTGDELWVRKLPSTAWSGAALALALDDLGSVYVTGQQLDSLLPATVKYSPDGDLIWGHRAWGTDIVVDDSGYVYVAGYNPSLTKLSQLDSDADGIIDLYDNCLSTPNSSQTNGDQDSLGDACDNCPQVTNPNQAYSITLTGDVDQNGTITSSDIIHLVNFVFKSGSAPVPCAAAGDANCTGTVTSADIVILVNYVFKAGPTPCDVCQADSLHWSCL